MYGSSPLARGLPSPLAAPVLKGGIIPARAGFTSLISATYLRNWDHPRSRGVYPRPWLRQCSRVGSSPLARGLRSTLHLSEQVVGIIPARAGFTHTHFRDDTAVQDHPRSRGVYSSRNARRRESRGSSPLARGLPRRPPQPPSARGIIPARAGFTLAPGCASAQGWDHPRSRGVYARVEADAPHTRGSSPLARGLRPLTSS